MNKPDKYMPMFWPDFWQAVEGLDCRLIVAYQRCLSKYWFHLHCSGLDDDDDQLRRLCQLDKDEWEDWKKHLFSKNKQDRSFWYFEHGKWHNKRALEIWNWVNELSQKRSVAGKRGAIERWKE